ncbi:UNVERIFIED_CONTAM: hypothetical protein GTU68_001409 [Idotea baltica]|nr:hypothetical protein [Idotea baltica]
MQRAIDIAAWGAGYEKSNPLVGAVLVWNDEIIGEGYHQKFGTAHAEVNAINDALKKHPEKIREATIYISLEPCFHFGKTPPCVDLLLKHEIKKVLIANIDPHIKVANKSIAKLEASGVEVHVGLLADEASFLNRRFFTVHQKQRPFVILKWAESVDGFLAPKPATRLQLSNAQVASMNQTWRAQEMAIMVGTNTAEIDNPQLSNRSGWGDSPIRIVIDRNGRLSPKLNIFDGSQETIVFTSLNKENKSNLEFVQIDFEQAVVPQILFVLYEKQIKSLIVEGGAMLLQSFIELDCWDEIRQIKTNSILKKGLTAPKVNAGLRFTQQIGNNTIRIYNPI